jgi:hypothetical protein
MKIILPKNHNENNPEEKEERKKKNEPAVIGWRVLITAHVTGRKGKESLGERTSKMKRLSRTFNNSYVLGK